MASLEDTAMTAAKEGKHDVASQKYREACEANASAPLLRVKLAIELQLAGLLDATTYTTPCQSWPKLLEPN